MSNRALAHLRTRFFQFTVIWLLSTPLAVAGDRTAPSLILAVHPYLSHNEIARKFSPLAEYLGTGLKRKIEVRVGETYQKHIETVGANAVDIAFMGPASYISLVEQYGPRPLLARLSVRGRPFILGHIVTRRNNGLKRLSDLQGKRFAFGDPDSTMSYLLPRYALSQAGVDLASLGDYRFFRSHEAVALAVLAGDADAGAVKAETFEKYRHRGLRSIYVTPAVSEHLFVTRADLPADLIKSLRQLMLALRRNTPEGRRILQSLRSGTTALVPVKDADYAELRQILSHMQPAGTVH